jgi:hypothetical protein
MLFVVRAVDADGNTIVTEPLNRKDALMKLWELKTSGCTMIRTFDAETGAIVDLVQKPDDEPMA